MSLRLFFLFVFLPLFTIGQDHYTILEMEYEYAPNVKQKDMDENTLDIQEYEGNLSVPLLRENGDAFVVGIGYNNLKLFPNQHKQTDVLPDTVIIYNPSLSRFRLSLGYNKKFNENSSVAFVGFFRIASDMVDVSSRDYLYGGAIIHTKKKNDRFTLKYGIYTNSEHYGYLIIPLIGCDWKVNEKLRIYGLMPRALTIAWKLNEKYRTGFIWEAPNRSYRLSENSVTVLSSDQPIDAYVQNIKNVVYCFGEVYVTKSLVLRGRVGYTLSRQIELYEYQSAKTYNTWGIEYGAKRTRINDVYEFRRLQDGVVLNASLEYRFKLP